MLLWIGITFIWGKKKIRVLKLEENVKLKVTNFRFSPYQITMNVADIDGPHQGKLVSDKASMEDQTFEETTCKELEQPEGHFFYIYLYLQLYYMPFAFSR